jgi:hypothetical protein
VPVVLVAVPCRLANDCAGFVNLVEGIHVQALVAQMAVEGFNVLVASGLTWWNEVNA